MNNKVKLCSILSENKDLVMILNIIDTFNLKNYYIHGEIVYQSVWNYLENRTPSYKNRRISIVYYDENDISLRKEVQVEKELLKILSRYGMFYEISIHNAARQHVERKKHPILNRPDEGNSEQILKEASMTIASVGIRQVQNNLEIYAPYDVKDIFNKTLRPIYHAYASPQTYVRQCNILTKEWEGLNVIQYSHNKNNM